MRKLVKWLLTILGGMLALIGLILGIGWFRLNQDHRFPVRRLQVSDDAQSIERGKHIVEAIGGCKGCHGEQLEGKMMIDNPLVATLPAPNLTPASDVAMMSDEEWSLIFRHGVDEGGKTLLIMPSVNYSKMTDADLAAVVAYIKSVPADEHELPEKSIGPLGYLFAGLGQLDGSIQVDLIDHNQAPSPIEAGAMAEYGKYLVTIGNCTECHGANLTGGASSDRGSNRGPDGPNLTTGGPLRDWSEADFVQALRTGVEPNGSKITDLMPWKNYRLMTDRELEAIWLYLRSLR